MFYSSYNSFGQIGLIQTPSADSRPEGSIAVTLNKNDIWKFGTLTASPFDWLEASYFYYRPSDLTWEGNNKRGHYLDKGFNVKLIYRSKNNNVPNIAIGLDDFAGTGYFTREYVVATSIQSNIKYSLGIGWGKYAGNNSFKNPLSDLSRSLLLRPLRSDNYNQGGSLSYDQWFRGNASIFGGFEWRIPYINGLNLKLEYDPFNYLDFSARNRSDAAYEVRKKDSDLNIGLSYALNKHLTIDASYIKGNTFNLSFNMGITFNDSLATKPKFNPVVIKQDGIKKEKSVFYENLLFNLNNNSLFLQTSTLHNNGNLDLTISTADHRNAIRSSSYAAYISKEVADLNDIDLGLINVAHINAGIELNNITYIAQYLSANNNVPIELKIRNSTLDSGNTNKFLEDEFKPSINFPVIFSSISPSIVSHVGNPEKFYFGGINLQYISEVQFNRNLLLSTELSLPLYDNFQDTISGPSSAMKHVRTDLIQYLKEDDMHIKRMQLDYIWTPYKDIYAKITGGIFEPMFGGFGGELLFKPYNKNYNIGLELFHVKQRSFDQRFNFQDYETVTGHITLGYQLAAGIESKLSFGRYLAKDDGYTLDIGRRTKSGFKAGVYFTRTNVSAELFGEGSFDKGFYFQIPIDLFNNEYRGNYSTFKLSPLTRDGGARLIHDKDLRGLIYNSSFHELNRQWGGFLN
ncbi:YjbH domain-containing protein [Gammaproteobacteria bacterium]|nr:YjbH domain-containing protein [Gammaproteobacteria bacterium]